MVFHSIVVMKPLNPLWVLTYGLKLLLELPIIFFSVAGVCC